MRLGRLGEHHELLDRPRRAAGTARRPARPARRAARARRSRPRRPRRPAGRSGRRRRGARRRRSAGLEPRPIPRGRLADHGGRRRVVGVRPADHVEQERAVLGRARERADGVVRPRDGDDAAVRDAARRRPDARSRRRGPPGCGPSRRCRCRARPATRPAATAAPLPPLEPPQIRSVSHGLRAGPNVWLVVDAPQANSCVLSFPTITAPARRRRATTVASAAAMLSARTFDAAVVRVPATSITSLTPIGTPCSGPFGPAAPRPRPAPPPRAR